MLGLPRRDWLLKLLYSTDTLLSLCNPREVPAICGYRDGPRMRTAAATLECHGAPLFFSFTLALHETTDPLYVRIMEAPLNEVLGVVSLAIGLQRRLERLCRSASVVALQCFSSCWAI